MSRFYYILSERLSHLNYDTFCDGVSLVRGTLSVRAEAIRA